MRRENGRKQDDSFCEVKIKTKRLAMVSNKEVPYITVDSKNSK